MSVVKETQFAIYDGRYYSDPEEAYLFEVCDTLEEAKENAPEHGDGNAIVRWDIEDGVIVKETLEENEN